VTDRRERKNDDRRYNQRAALTAHFCNSLISASNEDFPDARKMVLRAIYFADIALDFLDRIPEGEVDPTLV